jgi:hypothetical protein
MCAICCSKLMSCGSCGASQNNSHSMPAQGSTSLCVTAALQNPATLPRFLAIANRLTWLTWLVIPSFDLQEATGPADSAGPHHCYAIIVAMHLVLGFFLPTVAAYIAERRSRAEFLAAEAGASGSRVLEAAAGGRLGLPAHEGLRACIFDSVAAWVLCAALLPAVAATRWFLILLLSHHWATGGAVLWPGLLGLWRTSAT